MQAQLKVLAPVITRDVSLPNRSKKVPMVIIHVPDSLSLMAVPLATLMTTTTTTASAATAAAATTGPVSAAISALNSNTASSISAMAMEISADIHGGRLGNNNNFISINSNNASTKDEQQAKDLLTWNDDGIGTLEGCDLRFKINQLGCLELLDSEDESHPDYHNNINQQQQQQQQQQEKTHNRSKQSAAVHGSSSAQQRTQATNRTASQQHCHELLQQNDHRVSNSSTNSSSSGSTSSSRKSKIKQITPGSSLLRDGPNNWRARASSSSDTTTTTTTTTIPQTSSTTPTTTRSCTSTPLSRLVEITPNQQTILYEKLIPRKDLEEIKSKVKEWTTEDVRKFVDGIPGCAGYGQLFEFQQICGNSLLLLDLNDLTETIKIEYGPAVKIYNAVALMRDEIQLS